MAGRWAMCVLAIGFLAVSVAGAEPWRFFGGSFETQWRILGQRGHAEDCRSRVCDDRDLASANLDRSIGYRIGAEHALLRGGRWEFFAGPELNFAFTEYNSSQRDVRISEGFLVTGGRWDLGPFSVLGKAAGGGAAFDDGRVGFAHFFEAAAEVPLSRKAAVRFGVRFAAHGGPDSEDYSVVLVDGGGPPGDSRWQLGWSVGLSGPGRGAGQSLGLSTAPFSRLSLARRFEGRPDLFGITLQATAHESDVKTVYFGVPGNERGKTVHGGGLTWRRENKLAGESRWRYGLGLELSNWDDDHSLLLDSSGRQVSAGLEAGLLGILEGLVSVRPGMRLVLGAEKVYWRAIDLGELRVRVGIEISP